MVNKVTLDLASELLDLPEYTIAASELGTADIELLLKFLLHVCIVFISFQLVYAKFIPFRYSGIAVPSHS
jgi:hypothetical protein